MKHILIIFMTLFYISGPKMKVDGGRFVDIGDVKIGTVVHHRFIVKNIGDEDLIISGLGKSCNCTEVSMDTTLIKPGKTAMMSVRVDTKDKSGLSAVSVFLKDNTEDGENFVQLMMNCIK